ncbi:hypothetical protein OURE66S_03602 [Oligella ureolytica]
MKNKFQKRIRCREFDQGQSSSVPDIPLLREDPEATVKYINEFGPEDYKRRQVIRDWRRARKALRRYNGRVKAKLQSHWRGNRQQSDNPRHLISLIHRYDNGNLQVKNHE